MCWYTIINGNFKVFNERIHHYKIFLDKCVQCKYSIIKSSYQQNSCGTRYCGECYEDLKDKYYCPICKDEDIDNVVHRKDKIFLDKALNRDLEKMKVKCPDCETEIAIILLEHHARNVCEQRWEQCTECKSMYQSKDHTCNKQIEPLPKNKLQYKKCDNCFKEYENVKDHQCKMARDTRCPYECPIDDRGDVDIEKHRSESHLLHLDKAWAVVKDLKISDCKRHEESAQHAEWLDETVEKIKVAINYDSKELEQLKNAKISLTKKNEEGNKIFERIKKNSSYQTSELLNTSFDGTIMWRINNFSSHAGKNNPKSIFSPPFYTSRFGYKLCLRLYPNGDSTVEGKYMSIFLVIMKGQYDSMLRWPFKQKFTFWLINQQDLKNHVKIEFIPDEHKPSFYKPISDMNIPSGSSNFIKLMDLTRSPVLYVKNDAVFIRCVVDCSDLHE